MEKADNTGIIKLVIVLVFISIAYYATIYKPDKEGKPTIIDKLK